MLAFRIHRFGGPEVLQLEELPLPEPRDDEVLLKVHAASVNPIDYKLRAGARNNPEQLPIPMGRDVCGIVERCGPSVKDAQQGDGMYAMLGMDRGGYAEYVIARAGERAHMAKTIDHIHSAAIPLAALTACQGLFDHGKLTAGQRALIHGGAGGVGHFAIQLAKAAGAWVATTVSRQDVEFARQLGADQVIDYQDHPFENELQNIDLVYDLIGGDTQTRSLKVLKNGGALISTLQQPDEAAVKAKGLRAAHYMAKPSSSQLVQIAQWVDEGKVKPRVAMVFPLKEAARAQETLEKEHVAGKIVLQVASPS